MIRNNASFDISFRTVESRTDLFELLEFAAKHNPGYANYMGWLEKVEDELSREVKTAILGKYYDRTISDLIFQQSKTDPNARELKNLRVIPEFSNRYVPRFMLRQIEGGLGEDFDYMVCDALASQVGVINFMKSCGYVPVNLIKHPDDNQSSIVLVKFPRGVNFGDIEE